MKKRSQYAYIFKHLRPHMYNDHVSDDSELLGFGTIITILQNVLMIRTGPIGQ
jgi:hypothetical protein